MVAFFYQYVLFGVLLLPLSIFGCKNNSAVMSRYSKAPAVTEVVVNKKIDLGGKKWILPSGATLLFESGGSVENGCIVFDKATIKSESTCFKSNLTFSGTINNSVDIEWFDIQYDKEIDNSCHLNNALLLASLSTSHSLVLRKNSVIYVKSHFDSFDASKNDNLKYLRKGTVSIPSGTTFDLNGSIIKCMPNDKSQYNILFAKDVHDIEIRNGIIEGDMGKHIYANGTNEWGFGIELQGVSDFLIQNIICRNCTGDGIDIQASLSFNNGEITNVVNCQNGRIIDCSSYSNGRNALSIEGCQSLEILGSEFSLSSRVAPRAGIDIEPSISFGIIDSIVIDSCVFNNNQTYGLMIYRIGPKAKVSNITIKDCQFCSQASNHHIFNNGGSNVQISSCTFETNVRESYQIRISEARKIIIEKCSPSVSNGLSILLDGHIDSCFVNYCDISSFKLQQFQSEAFFNNIYIVRCNIRSKGVRHCVMEHSSNLHTVSVSFDNCLFDYKKTIFSNLNNLAFILPEGPNVSYVFKNCDFQCNGSRIIISNSVSIIDSSLDNTSIVAHVNNGSRLVFTNNTLSHHVDTNRSIIAITGNKNAIFEGDFSGLKVLSSNHSFDSIIDGNKLDTSRIKIDNQLIKDVR